MKIKFTGKDQPPPTSLTIGSKVIALPENQKRPFNHEDGKLITRTFPELYKRSISKGDEYNPITYKRKA